MEIIALVVKTIVVRKSLGPKGPCGSDSRPRHTLVIDNIDAKNIIVKYVILKHIGVRRLDET